MPILPTEPIFTIGGLAALITALTGLVAAITALIQAVKARSSSHAALHEAKAARVIATRAANTSQPPITPGEQPQHPPNG